MSEPGGYRSLEEFEREEIRPHQKAGWSLDDLWADAEFKRRDHELDEPKELDFDY